MKLIKERKWMILLMIIIPFTTFGKIDETKEAFKTQNVLLPSPTAASLGQFGEVPIGLFTGTVQLNIPIYELASGSLSVPIGLSYSSNGVKVDQVASNVGMGWNLNAGGVITRTVLGKPDEFYPLKIPQNLSEENQDSYKFIYQANDLGTNTQPDVFNFNFLGYSGQFILDENRNVYGIPHQSLQIEPNIFVDEEVEGEIIITTPDGIKFTFGGLNATEKTKNTSSGTECGSNSFGSDEITTSWYLSRIDHPDGNYITFKYGGVFYSYDTSASQTIRRIQNLTGVPEGCGELLLNDNTYECVSTATIWGRELTEIRTSSGGWVDIKYSDIRPDLSGCHRVHEILINKPNDARLKSWKLDYLFSNNTGGLNKLHLGGVLGNDNAVEELKTRMFLASVVERDANDSEVCRHSLKYKEPNKLPARLSFDQDHWGYYNAAGNNNLVPNITNSLFGNYNGADRESNSSVSSYGMIEKITYPTGGSSAFEYSMNSKGGNRISKVITKENPSDNGKVKRYFYNKYANRTTPIERGVTFYKYLTESTITHICQTSSGGGSSIGGIITSVKDVTYYYGHSNSQISLYGTGSQPSCFPYVTVSHGENFENGGEEHEFDINLDTQGRLLYGADYILSCPFNNHSWNNGNKVLEKHFKLVNGTVVSQLEKKYHYTVDSRNAKTFKAYVIGENGKLRNQFSEDPNIYPRERISHINVMEYSIVSNWKYLEFEESYTFDKAGNNPVVTRSEYYYDNKDHAQMTKRIEYLGENKQELRRFYSKDYNSVKNVSTLNSKYMIGLPIKTEFINNGFQIGGEIIEYNNIGQPIKVYDYTSETLKVPAAHNKNSYLPIDYKVKLSLSYLTNYNKLVQVDKRDGLSEVYLWGYDHTLPIFKIDNSSFSEVMYVLGRSSNDDLTYLQNMSDVQLEIEFNKLRNNTNTEYVSMFTYEPMVGLLSQTDANGVSTHYTYDNFGRLSTVKNDDKETVSVNNYKYYSEGNQSSFLTLAPSSLSYGSSISSKTITVSSNTQWSVTSKPSWISISNGTGTNNGTFIATSQVNPGGARSGDIVVNSGGIPKSISVSQDASATLIVNRSNVAFDSGGLPRVRVDVTCNTNWTVTSADPWVILSTSSKTGNGYFYINTLMNRSSSYRMSFVTVRAGDKFYDIDVVQNGTGSTGGSGPIKEDFPDEL